MDVIKTIEAEQLTEGRENFRIGDTVKVHYKIVEGQTERIQVYEGLVIAMNNGGVRKTVTVRKMSYGVGVERVFPLHSPKIEKIELVRHGRVRRADAAADRERIRAVRAARGPQRRHQAGHCRHARRPALRR